MKQQFFKGDHVFIGDMPPYMKHFTNNCEAIVLYTYAEKYGASGHTPHKEYCVYILPNGGETSWYKEDQFRLLGTDRFDLLPKNHVDRTSYENKKAMGRMTLPDENIIAAQGRLLRQYAERVEALEADIKELRKYVGFKDSGYEIISVNALKELTDEEIKSEAKYFCHSWHSQNPERLVLFARAILKKAS
jgi:hypothetical protein